MTVESGWALVDVETSGLRAREHRVLSVAAITMDSSGRVEEEFSTLLNPGCDPGPVHIHRLTRERLRGAPTFDTIVEPLTQLLDGRTLVAHNAAFDHGFLVEEARRAGAKLPTAQRLCTVTLARRLQLDVPDVKLGTLARHWGIRQDNAHDALDDARTLTHVFRRSVDLADSLGLGLPIVACGASSRAYPDKVTRVPCPWREAGRYDPAIGLVQGTKIVITGPTNVSRTELAHRLADAGMDVMSGISRKTGLLVVNAGAPHSRKLERAGEFGTPIVDEATVLRLAADPVAGVPKSAPAEIEVIDVISTPARPPKPAGPWAGRRTLVLGGSHLEATVMRSRIVQLGGVPAINLTSRVTQVLVLSGGEGDPRMTKIINRKLTLLAMADVDAALGLAVPKIDTEVDTEPDAETEVAPMPEPVTMTPGMVIDLPTGLHSVSVNVAWSAAAIAAPEVDVVAFELDTTDRVPSDDEFVFFNQPASPDGSVSLSIDGDREQGITVQLGSVPEDIARVSVGAAIERATFGDLGPLSVTVDSGTTTIATAVLDAATSERSMIVAEVYRRRDVWRLRILGQGYDDDLAAFAVRHGVEVDG
ncbi:TerD family protein [Gordonia sp. (in: high G+C Gram-positive bacteria)]|uniref:TerD family protein n=1 Tax=Gordonia sp. (in: high G+C Gram-positive bacteria) TaxID=84139 RepID=UPI0025C055BB|nr:TerD family protein [Gordonia sp. (in: high G+C Gram-positive bacteria)]HMS74961.1 TerD family protein [Gordonia sp. (in: high G+C Gram-positive bacteria)]HQV17218.1 TerD family protein [Gordonia sp. (in: high G+C Gram-positive bacteria)]